jgi:phage-related protein
MPQTEVYFYQESEADVLVWDWLRDLARTDRKAAAACVVRIRLLAMLGHELRRPSADYLRDGIHELRVKRGRVNYRVLYFFHGQNVALLAHSLTKEREVPSRDIDRAVERRRRYEKSPFQHRATFVVPQAPDDL